MTQKIHDPKRSLGSFSPGNLQLEFVNSDLEFGCVPLETHLICDLFDCQHTHNNHNDKNNGDFDVLPPHGSGQAFAGFLECQRLGKKNQILNTF